jgi:hypothetical protein
VGGCERVSRLVGYCSLGATVIPGSRLDWGVAMWRSGVGV